MKNRIIHSTVFKIGALLFAISFMAVVSMFSSVFVSDGAQNDAHAINVAGSLRMQSYRILSLIQQHTASPSIVSENEILGNIQQLERDLLQGTLAAQSAQMGDETIRQLFPEVVQQWNNRVKPVYVSALSSPYEPARLTELTRSFVANIDRLVLGFQQQAERNIATIRLIQSLALFLMLFFIAFALFIISRHVEKPLSNLTNVAKQLERGDFTAVADESGKDELAILAKAMNKMSRAIYRSHNYLEERVKTKTAKLEKSNASLSLLFDIATSISHTEQDTFNFEPIMKKLADVTGIRDLDLCIMTEQGFVPYEHIVTSDKDLPDKCIQHDCQGCIEHENIFAPDQHQLKYALKNGDADYGVLVVSPSSGELLEEWQHKLFEAVAEQVATGLSLQERHVQTRRIALMQERTVIARELHDSLAQALSYLKIQVSRLQKLKQKDNSEAQIDEVIGELKGGLSSAYRELRELLTTFRLKLDSGSIRSALQQTIQQLMSRSDQFEFTLVADVSHLPLTPQEEIHLLQIAREATQNAFYHSKGRHIDIHLSETDEPCVKLSIQDDGIGIPDDPNKLNHYGLAIMQERSRSLDGTINICTNPMGGTRVEFSFVPQYMRDKQKLAQTA
ncbi:histidine kinase [Aestuariibacter halophilus]|uniref:Sensor protein n=1 Tax=Fluctibacter halophilus TaxID=226011 RepID=A0ABS8G4N1_9ALTE|nr:histidine kinase [Aestuariibacter halophilus]MCC2615066.1 histidine kinase [Aestuariibacter halophilus]